MLLFLVFAFVFGLFWGSFLKVVADRLPRGESPIGGRSYCEHCKHKLGSLDLVPLFSFLLLRGKCRYCHTKLSVAYPISEILTASVIALSFYLVYISNFQFSIFNFQNIELQYMYYLFIISGLIIIFFADLKYYIIPFQVLIPSIFIALLWQWFFNPDMFLGALLSGVVAFGFFFLIFILTKGRGMGFGDVVFSFYMGILLGFPSIIVGQYVAFLTGALVSVILILARLKKLKGGVIPFGPFLILGTYVGLFWGVRIWDLIRIYF